MIEELKAVMAIGIEMIKATTTSEQYKGAAKILSSVREVLNNVGIGVSSIGLGRWCNARDDGV